MCFEKEGSGALGRRGDDDDDDDDDDVKDPLLDPGLACCILFRSLQYR